MKQFIIFLVLIAAVIVFFVLWQNNNQESQQPNETDQLTEEMAQPVTIPDGEYAISGTQDVAWQGSKPKVTNYVDRGTLTITDGTLSVASAEVSGELVFDMTTIQAEETGKGTGSDQLTNHLQSEDFFSVSEYPTATFTLTDIEEQVSEESNTNFMAHGTLAMKGIEESVSFPVGIATQDDGSLQVIGKATLDRTRWDVRFGSDKFFDNLADNVIADTFTVSFAVPFQPVEE